MKKPFSLSFRSTLLTLILLVSIVPAILLSIVLVKDIRDLKYASADEALKLKTSQTQSAVEKELALVISRLQSIANINDVILATKNSIFGYKVNKIMSTFLAENPLVSSLYLTDKEHWPVEVVPPAAEIVSISPLTPLLDEFYALKPEDVNAYKTYHFTHTAFIQSTLKASEYHQSSTNFRFVSDQGFMLAIPLVFTFTSNNKELSGSLIAIIPLENILNYVKTLVQSNEIAMVDQQQNLKGEAFNFDAYLSSTTTINIPNNSTPISLKIMTPKEKIVADIQQNLFQLLIYIAIYLSFVLLIAWFITSRLVSPVKSISGVVQNYLNEHYQTDIEHTNFQEFDDILTVLKSLGDKVSHDKARLHARVKQRTEELESTSLNLSSTLHQLNNLNQKLEIAEKNASISELVTRVAHELNTPIGVCITSITYMTDKVDLVTEKNMSKNLTKAAFDDFLNTINESSQIILSNLSRAAKLLSDFKEVSIEAKIDHKENINIKEFFEDVFAGLKSEMFYYDIDIIIIGDETIQAYTYKNSLEKIIINLVMNTLIHGFKKIQKHTIELHFEQQNNILKLTLSDDGQGVSESNLTRLFDPFFTTKRNEGYAGLGLYIVKSIINHKFGGKVTCSNYSPTGLRFDISLPIDNIKSKIN